MSQLSLSVSSDRAPTRVGNFTPLTGHWTFDDQCARYSGGLNDGDIAGLALSDMTLSKGSVKATVTFDTDRIECTSGGIVLGYARPSSSYLVIELAAYEAAYAVAEFIPAENDWRKLQASGCFRSIAARRPYSIEVVQLETGITLVVDQVKVLEHDLSAPLTGDRVGLFGWGGRDITFEDVSVQPAPLLFVAMPFTESFVALYRRVLLPTAKKVGFEVIRMDDWAGPGNVVEDVKEQIAQAEVVLAEISSHNPNVMWELGFAEALQKRTVLLAQRGKEPPFDIRGYRVIYYDDTIGGELTLEEALENHLTAVFATGVPGGGRACLAGRMRRLGPCQRTATATQGD